MEGALTWMAQSFRQSQPMENESRHHYVASNLGNGHQCDEDCKWFAQRAGNDGQWVANDGNPTQQQGPLAMTVIPPLCSFQ